MLSDELMADAYFMRRLASTRMIQGLTASIQFDLARSPVSDDELDAVATEFGTPPSQGWGMAEVAHEMLSAQPTTIATRDLVSLQKNLVEQGYLESGYQSSGVWDDESYGALRRFDRDNADAQRTGRGFLSGPIEAGLRMITNTLPSMVWQGTVGAAKGLVMQTPETAERVGLVGGAIGGAIIGTAVLPGVGTAVGAGVGGIAGFFADLLGEEEGEEDQSDWGNLLDALTPYEEYVSAPQGVRAFYEDLGYVFTAASMIGGAKLAASGVQKGLAAARGTQAAASAPMVGAPGEMASFGGAPSFGRASMTTAAPEVLAKAGVPEMGAGGIAKMALEHPIATGALAGGFVGAGKPGADALDILEGAAYGAVVGLGARAAMNLIPGTSQWITYMRTLTRNHSLVRKPTFLMANGVYTGLAAGSLGARFGAGVHFAGGDYETTIEEAIRTTKPLEVGPKIPYVGNLVDWSAFLLYPTQFFPWKGKQLSAGLDTILGAENLRPWAHLMQRNSPGLSFGKSVSATKELFSKYPEMPGKLDLDMAVDQEAFRLLELAKTPEARQTLSYKRTTSSLRRKILDEGTKLGYSPTAQGLVAKIKPDIEAQEAWAIHHIGTDKPFDVGISDWVESQAYLTKWEADARRAGTLVEEAPSHLSFNVAGPGGTYMARAPQAVVPTGFTQEGASRLAIQTMERDIAVRERMLKILEKGKPSNPMMIMRSAASKDIFKAELSSLRRELEFLRKSTFQRKRMPDEVHLTVARLETNTRTSVRGKQKEFIKKRDELQALHAESLKPNPDPAVLANLNVKSKEWEFFVRGLETESLLSARTADKAILNFGKGTKATNELEVHATVAARDVQLPPDAMAELSKRGYKPVITGDEVFMPGDVEGLLGQLQVKDFTKRRSFIETVGFSPRWSSEKSQYEITWAGMQSEVEAIFKRKDVDVPLKGPQAIRLIEKYLREINSDALIDVENLPHGAKALATVLSNFQFKADIRRMNPGQVEKALEHIPGVTPGVANEVFQALKRGGAYGSDASFRHPVVTARTLGRSLRTSGWPGASSLIRSWHAKGFEGTLKGDVMRKDLVYKPPSSMLRSAERNRFAAEIQVAGVKAKLNDFEIRESQRMYDVLAEAAMNANPEKYKSVDDVFRGVSVRYAEEYVAGADTLRQAIWLDKKPTARRLDALVKRGEVGKNWWSDSGEDVGNLFGMGTTKLRDGTQVSDSRLMANLIPATSANAAPDWNARIAIKLLNDFKAGRPVEGVLPSVKKMAEEIFNGHTIDKWTSAQRKSRHVIVGKYENLTGNLKEITYDSVMTRAMGMSKEKGVPLIEAAAARMGWEPAEVQAAIWVGFKDEAATHMEALRRAAIRRGDMTEANSIGKHIAVMRKALTYKDAFKLPEAQKLMDTYGESLGLRLTQKVEDTVRGSIDFGDDMKTVIQLYSTGGFDTLVHEAGHLMRRIVPPDVARSLEARYKVGKAVADVERDIIDVTSHLDELVTRTTDLVTKGRGGATFDPHTGRFVEGEGYSVATNYGTVAKVGADEDPAVIRQAIADFIEENKVALRSEKAHVGTWNDREGMIHLDVSEVLFNKAEALQRGAERGQEAIFDLKKLEDIAIDDAVRAKVKPTNWNEGQEERFANEFTAYLLGKLKGDAGPLAHLKEAVASLWGFNRDAMVDRGLIPMGLRREFDGMFKESLERSGIRRPKGSLASKQVLWGTALGAAEGATMGTGDKTDDILKGALFGGAAGLLLRTGLRKSYGYLPDMLANANMALRYSLSFTFDAGRFTEQNMIAAQKFGIPMFLKPQKHAMGRDWLTPYAKGKVTGKVAWEHMHRFFDELNGTNYFTKLSESEQRLFQSGMLGFSPRDFEAVQAFYLYQRGWSEDKIREAVAQIGRYGLGRTTAERSANFIFFPFSFAKKLLTTMGDFILQTPGRNLLIHEGMRRYHDSTLDEGFHELVEQHAPVLEQLWMINNLAFGMSLGRFFLEGLDDRRTNVGRVSQFLASIFVPSGAATPMQQAAGAIGDLSVNAFTPVVLTGESISRAGGVDGLDDIFRRYIPMVREIENYANALNDQRVAVLSGSHLTPWSQFQAYAEAVSDEEETLEPLATAFGYATVDSFLASPLGSTYKPEMDRAKEQLRQKYPQGWEITTTFENTPAIDAAAKLELAAKVNKTEGEEAMVQLIEQQEVLSQLTELLPEELAAILEQNAIRQSALKWVDDLRFAELYDRFMARTYGPIRRPR